MISPVFSKILARIPAEIHPVTSLGLFVGNLAFIPPGILDGVPPSILPEMRILTELHIKTI